ncbi:MAG: FG-GAP repeat domain-containing protein [Planctomycetota bacterium]|jgi:hypothetical protein
MIYALRSSFVLPLIVFVGALPVAAQQFVYDGAALPAQTVWTDGVAFADVDMDGDTDIIFANGSTYGSTGTAGAQPQHLFLNNGSGVFSAAHGQLNVANFNAKMVIAEDFDGDGDPDLMYASGSMGHPPRLLLNDGTGNFTDVTATNLPVLALRSFGICAGDVDDDGDLDVVLTDGGTFGGIPSQARLLLNDGGATFTDVTATHMPVDLYNAQDVTLLDFDGDFDVDIVLSGKGQSGKRGRLYLNDGTGHFSVNNAMDQLGTGNTYEIDWPELDGDSDFDAAVQSISGVSEGWARNDGTGVLMPEFVFPAPNGGDDNEMAGLDYDDDGDLDVFTGSLAISGEKVWRNEGGGVFVNDNASIQTIGDSTLDLGFADLDGDGDHDMVTGQGESGNFTNRVYRNVGPPDTRAPRLIDLEEPSLSTPETVFHLTVQDAIADDGRDGALLENGAVTYSYSTSDGGSGTGTATRMGGGLYRAGVPTTGSTDWVGLTYEIRDRAGNTSGASTTAGTPPSKLIVPIDAKLRWPTSTPSTKLIGAITVSAPGAVFGAAKIDAKFELFPAYAFLDDWYDFRWVNVQHAYKVDGVFLETDPVTGKLPAIDSQPGQLAPGLKGPDGVGDDEPFYYNPGNWNIDAANPTGCPAGTHTEGKGSVFQDSRFDGAVDSVIYFATYLVVQNKTDTGWPAEDPFCTLGGFAWQYHNLAGNVVISGDLLPDAGTVRKALKNGAAPFPSKSVVEGPDCPLQACVQGPFLAMANGLDGTHGMPELQGTGTLGAGTLVSLDLTNALENSVSTMVVGFSGLFGPLKGGVLVPNPDLLLFGLPTDGAGQLSLSTIWPGGVPSGLDIFYQHWIVDPAGPAGFSASNGLVSFTP